MEKNMGNDIVKAYISKYIVNVFYFQIDLFTPIRFLSKAIPRSVKMSAP